MAKELRRIVCALMIAGFWFSPAAHARDGDYGEVVERNLELRRQIKAWEEKYTAVENERNVLILHIRDLQNEKDALNRTLEELKAGPGDIPKFISQNLKLNKSLEDALKRNSLLGHEMEGLKKEILLLKGERAEALKMLEIERNDFARKLQRAQQEVRTVEETPEGQPLEKAGQAMESQPARAPEGRGEEIEKRLRDALQTFENEKRQLISQNEKFLKILQDQKASLEAEVQKAQTEDKGRKRGSNGLEKQLKDLKRENKSLETKARKIEDDLAAVQAVYVEKEKKWRKEKGTADKRIQDMEKKLARYAASVPSSKKRKEEGKAAVFLKDKQLLDMHYNLALAYNKTGMHAQERDEYLACLKIDPRDAHVHYNLAVLYDDNLNNNRKAVYHYQKYLELMPGDEDGARVKEWILRAEEEDRIGVQMR